MLRDLAQELFIKLFIYDMFFCQFKLLEWTMCYFKNEIFAH